MNRKYAGTETRKEQIASAAAALIVDYGGEHLTIKKLAGYIGLSEAAIYRHFRSKTEIYHFVIQHMKHMLLGALEIDPGRITGKTIEALMLNHVDMIEKSLAVEFQAVAEIISLGDRYLCDDMYEAVSTYIDSLKQILEKGKNGGFVHEEVNTLHAALLWFSLINGLANLWVLSGRSFKLSRRFRELWPFYRRAVLSGRAQ